MKDGARGATCPTQLPGTSAFEDVMRTEGLGSADAGLGTTSEGLKAHQFAQGREITVFAAGQLRFVALEHPLFQRKETRDVDVNGRLESAHIDCVHEPHRGGRIERSGFSFLAT